MTQAFTVVSRHTFVAGRELDIMYYYIIIGHALDRTAEGVDSFVSVGSEKNNRRRPVICLSVVQRNDWRYSCLS